MNTRLHHRRFRRGVVLVYIAVSAVALIGIASLAADYGRVQLGKYELERTLDAAVRAAVSGLPTVSDAESRAIATAGQNKLDGASFSLSANEIQFLNWDNSTHTYTVLSGLSRSSANAIRISARRTMSLMLARVAGRSTCDVTASSIAMIEDTSSGLVALDSLTVKNNAFIASYNSGTTTNPNNASSGSKAGVSSNGDITGKNNNVIKGNIILGPSGSESGFAETGTTTVRSSDVETPADPTWSPSGNPGGISQNYTASGNVTLPGGTYYFTSLTVNGTLSFSGSATVYLNGNADINGDIFASSSIPSNLKIYQLGANRAFGDSKSNNMDIIAVISSPGGSLTAKNNFKFRGGILFKKIELKNNGDIYIDEALGDATVSTRITTVR